MPNWNGATDWQNTLPAIGAAPMIGGQPGYVSGQTSPTLLFGDSMVAREWLISATETSKVGYGWINHANAILGQPFDVVGNYAVTGYTCDQTMGTIGAAEVGQMSSGYIIVSCGTNDVFANGDRASTVVPKIKAILGRLADTGALVIWMNLTPRTFVNQTQAEDLININYQITAWAQGQRNILVFDAASVIVNPTSNQYIPTSGYNDGAVHLNNSGASLVGAAFATFMQYRVFPRSNLISTIADTYTVSTDSVQIWSNPLMQGTGGTFAATGGGATPTGTAPDTVQVDHAVNTTGDCVVSVATRTVADDGDTIGSSVILTIGGVTPAGANDRWTIRNSGNISTGASPGDWLQLECAVKIAAQTNLSGLPFFAQFQTNTSAVCTAYDLRHDTNNVTYQSGFTGGKLRTLPFQLPAGTTLSALQWRLEPRFTTAGGTATIRLGRVSMRNLTRAGLR